jgi:hypothetical protein
MLARRLSYVQQTDLVSTVILLIIQNRKNQLAIYIVQWLPMEWIIFLLKLLKNALITSSMNERVIGFSNTIVLLLTDII